MTHAEHVYLHRSTVSLQCHSDALEACDEDFYLNQSNHSSIRFERSNKQYQYGTAYSPLRVLWDDEHWGEFNWKKLNFYDLNGKVDQEERVQELISYLTQLAGGYFSCTLCVDYAEICCFFDRRHKKELIRLARLADEQFCLNNSEKRKDTAYSGVPEEFISGELQTNRGDPIFRMKIYEAIRVEPVGFKEDGRPKLEVQLRGKMDSITQAQDFGTRLLLPLLHHLNIKPLPAADCCIDHAGAISYTPIAGGIEGLDYQFIQELRAYECYSENQHWGLPQHIAKLYECIYHKGLRSKRELESAGIPRTEIDKAVQSGLLLVSGKGGAAGNTYRINYLTRWGN